MGNKVFITGATGFLGTALTNLIASKGYIVAALRRQSSNISNIDATADIQWVYAEDNEWEAKIKVFSPDVIIHAAWGGVKSGERASLPTQVSNLNLLSNVLAIAKTCGTGLFIGLGSQAEYGYLESSVKEDTQLHPVNAYGIAKVIGSELVKYFCDTANINWYWVRVFSVYGENESLNWFMPSLIERMLKNEPVIELTACTQQYAYLYVEDFGKYIMRLLENAGAKNEHSGVYNISGKEAMPLKEIVYKLQYHIPEFTGKLDFGVIPQRPDQSQHIEGYMEKYENSFGKIDTIDLDRGIEKMVHHYRKHINEVK